MPTYVICNGSTPVNYSITIAPIGSQTSSDWVSGNYHIMERYQTYRITSDVAIPAGKTLTVELQNLFDVTTCDFGPVEQEDNCTVVTDGAINNFTVDITAGNTYQDYVLVFYENYHQNPTGSGQKTDRYDLTVRNQSVTPSCAPQPAECTLSISVTTPSDPSQRGASDGTIYAAVAGQTGTTINWYINNVIDSGTAVTHTFTGLAQGTYYIKAMEDICYANSSAVIGEGPFVTGDFSVIDPTSNVVAVENPIMLNLGTAVNSYSPVISASEFRVTGSISNVVINFALTFPYEYNAEFRSKGYPDRSTYFLETQLKDQVGNVLGTNTAEEIATSIAEVFQNDPILSRIYFISSSTDTITLIAKEYSAEYDLTSANVTITGSNLSLTNVSPGVARYDGQLMADYSLYVELFVDDTIQYGYGTPNINYFRRVLELELPFSNDNIHQFDLSSTLKNFVSSPKISFQFTGVTFMGDLFASYFCKYGEKYPLVPNSNTKKKRYKGQTDFGWCLNSSLPFENDNSMDTYIGTFGIYDQQDVLFFNTAPNTKVSHRNAKEFMSLVVAMDYYNSLKVYADIYLYDGTEYYDVELFDIIPTGVTTNFGGMAVLSVGYNDLNLSVYETSSKIRKVDIFVLQSYGVPWIPYSEVKSYLLNIDEDPDNFNVAFLNSLGCYETYTFTGELVEQQDIVRESYQKPYPINIKGSATIGFQYNSTIDTKYTKTYIVNTGIIDADTFYFLQGLLQSNRIYHYDDTHENYLNVINHTSTKSTNDNEYSLQIQFKETISENNVNQ